MRNTVLSQTIPDTLLDSLLANEFAGALVQPFVNDVDPGVTAVLADFTAPAFTGGAAKAVGTWGAVDVTADNRYQSIAPTLQWQNTAGSEETVYGVFFREAGPGAFLGYARLEVPLAMAAGGNVLAIVPRLSIQRALPAGSFVQVDE